MYKHNFIFWFVDQCPLSTKQGIYCELPLISVLFWFRTARNSAERLLLFFSPPSCREFLLLLATNITCYHVFRAFTQSDFLKIFSGLVCKFALRNHFTIFATCLHLPSDSKLLCFLVFLVHVAYTEVTFLVSDVAFCSWAWLHFCIDGFACLCMLFITWSCCFLPILRSMTWNYFSLLYRFQRGYLLILETDGALEQ